MSSPADIVAQGLGLGPIGLIGSFLRIPGGGTFTGNPQNPYVGVGSMEDPYGPMQELEVFYGAGGVEPPAIAPDVPYATPPIAPAPTAPPVAAPGPVIAGPNSYPVPNRPPARRTEDVLRERLERMEREAEELRRRQQRRNTQPGGPKGPGKRPGGALGDYDDAALACMRSPMLCAIGGLLWPSTAGEGSTVLTRKQQLPRARPRPKFPGKAPKIPQSFDYRNLPMPTLPGTVATGLPQKSSPATRPVPRQRALPRIVKAKPKMPGSVVTMPSMPSLPSVTGWSIPGWQAVLGQVQKYAGLAIPLLQGMRRRDTAVNIRTSEPVSGVPFDTPLTSIQPISAAYPMTAVGSGGSPIVPRSGTLEDQCRNLRKRRKPKRRCIRRDDCNKCVEYEEL